MRIRVIYVMLAMLSLTAKAQKASDAADIERLTKEMYRLYPTDSVEKFMDVTDQLKTAALKAADERVFYKAWANQSLYSFNKVSRDKGLEKVKEMREYAEKHDSKFGVYSSSYANAGMLSTLQMKEQAMAAYQEALDYQHTFFPDESAAAPYLGMAKIYVNQKKVEKVRECARKALAEPGVIMQHQLSAWSYLCISYTGNDNEKLKEEFNRCYAEREKVKAAFGHDDDFGQVVDFEYALMNGHYDDALQLAQDMHFITDKYKRSAQVYLRMGNYRKALENQSKFYDLRDSLNSEEVKRETSELSVALEAARAKMEAQEQRERTHHIMMFMAGIMALIIIAALAFILHRRNKHSKEIEAAYDKLETAHEKLEDAYSRLEETTAAKERIESELRIAREIQMGMVPHIFSNFPAEAGIDLYALMNPAKEVGGDLYDFFLQGSRLYLCVGDVSGKGVPASMTMAVAVNLFRNVAKEGFPPEYIATRLNETLVGGNESGMFVTMFIAEIDLTTGRMNYCNAGHNPPIIIDRPLAPHEPCRPAFIEMESNAPLGLWPDLEYIGESLENVRRRTLFLYTDGITEAENYSHEQFGDERVLDFFKKRPYDSAKQTVDLMNAAVTAFVGDAEPSDDLTMLCFRIS